MVIVPALSVPVQPLLLASQLDYGVFEQLKHDPWVLQPYLYQDEAHLLASVESDVINPAEAKWREQNGNPQP